MQVLIALGLMSYAFASGDFSNKVDAHSRAVAATKLQIAHISETRIKFKELMKSCVPKDVTTQEKLLECGGRFLTLSLELKSLKSSQESALRTIAALAPEFAPAATALSKTLAENAKILSIVTGAPEQLSNAFFAVNSVYVHKQFERTSHDAFSRGRIRHYCEGLQSEINSLAQLATVALNLKLPFATLYKQQIRLRSTIALVEAMASVCDKTYDVAAIKGVLAHLNAALAFNNFLSYKKSVCQNPGPLTNLSTQDCMELPLSPYSIQWLEIAGRFK